MSVDNKCELHIRVKAAEQAVVKQTKDLRDLFQDPRSSSDVRADVAFELTYFEMMSKVLGYLKNSGISLDELRNAPARVRIQRRAGLNNRVNVESPEPVAAVVD
jgi:hypothetical protein